MMTHGLHGLARGFGGHAKAWPYSRNGYYIVGFLGDGNDAKKKQGPEWVLPFAFSENRSDSRDRD